MNDDRDVKEALDQLDAVLKLARANFPRTNRVTVRTDGSDPHASMSIPSYVLAAILSAARETIKERRS